jgi:ribosomal protein S18 acetylase RimI-like enzyme
VVTNDTRKRPPGHLRAEPGLGPEHVHEIEELAAACVAVDGGRLKLEWRTLQTRPPDQLNDFLWFGAAGLVGFLGIYGFRPDEVELCGMVHPSARRQGVFSRLFGAVLAELVDRRVPQALCVVDRISEAGTAFARSVGGTIEHSEHRMVLVGEPAAYVADPLVTVRPAELSDGPFLVTCLAEAFGLPAEHFGTQELEALARRNPGTLVIERAGEPVGTVRVERGDDVADVYGFAVRPQFQGRGIGRQVLSGLVSDLAGEGLAHVGLEVSCTNDSALHLYVSCGFEVTGTEDYYAVAVPPSRVP